MTGSASVSKAAKTASMAKRCAPRRSRFAGTQRGRGRAHRHSDVPDAKQLCKRWKEWVAGQVKKYFWDIDPEDADHPTIHGLRGTGILARAEAGYNIDQIANDIGMTRRNVEHYMRFREQMKVASDGKKRLQLVPKD